MHVIVIVWRAGAGMCIQYNDEFNGEAANGDPVCRLPHPAFLRYPNR